jgi:hypothetical protein
VHVLGAVRARRRRPGAIGLPPRKAERLARDAGFTRFRVHDFEDPANLYYEVQP